MSQLDFALLDETCFDVYLNDKAYWCCVPSTVWRYTIATWRPFDHRKVDHPTDACTVEARTSSFLGIGTPLPRT